MADSEASESPKSPESPQILIKIIEAPDEPEVPKIDTDLVEISIICPAHILPNCNCSIPSNASYTDRVLSEFACQYAHAESFAEWDRITDRFQAQSASGRMNMEKYAAATEQLIEARQASYARLASPHEAELRRSNNGLEESSESKSPPMQQKKLSLIFGPG